MSKKPQGDLFDPPRRMMPGEEPYTDEEFSTVQTIIGELANISEEVDRCERCGASTALLAMGPEIINGICMCPDCARKEKTYGKDGNR